MENTKRAGETVLVTGVHALSSSLSVCLLLGGHRVIFLTSDVEEATKQVAQHRAALVRHKRDIWDQDRLEVTATLKEQSDISLAFIIASEKLAEKKAAVAKLEGYLPSTAVIAVNTESIPLGQLQQGAVRPDRILGANWVEPVHTTSFLELICNAVTDHRIAADLMTLARKNWGKDPYLVTGELGIRAKLFSAMVREAFYLVGNEYASIEDIDRACRNDAGYYLPFAGNFRYMDLMGTYAYGMVMKDLNPELCNEAEVPAFFKEILAEGSRGMETEGGFYPYTEEEVSLWKERFRTFSYQIEEIIRKYPFNTR